MKKSWTDRLAGFFRREWLPCVLVLVLLAARLAALGALNATYSLCSDDMSYINSGITLAKTGMLTMHDNTVPTGQIMPGMSVVIALFYFVFGEGAGLWLALKLFWIAMGSLMGWFTYHSVRLYAPPWCAVLATLVLLRTDFLWTDNLILTETPTMLCFSILIYCTLQLGRTGERRYFLGGAAAYMIAVLFRANMAICILFIAVYLVLVRREDRKVLAKRGIALLLAMLCFFVPWTIRNYNHFKAFIPISFGAGNPVLLGTYQGVGYPLDEELDYETNVDAVMPVKYAKYYHADGTVPHEYQKYLELEKDAVMAKYRQKVWWQQDPASFLRSYLLLKPWNMMRGAFYWQRIWDIPHEILKALQKGVLLLCAAILITMAFRRENRGVLAFLACLYLGNIYFYSLAFSLDRYNMGLMPAVCVFLGIGLGSLGAVGKSVGRRLSLQAP